MEREENDRGEITSARMSREVDRERARPGAAPLRSRNPPAPHTRHGLGFTRAWRHMILEGRGPLDSAQWSLRTKEGPSQAPLSPSPPASLPVSVFNRTASSFPAFRFVWGLLSLLQVLCLQKILF